MTRQHDDRTEAGKQQKLSEKDRRKVKAHIDEMLDEALDETFPASDPIELTPEPDC